LQANLARFEELNAQVLGISVDSVHSHRAYAEQLGVTFPLLADFHPKGAVSQAYGLWRDDYGISKRAIIIVDEDGIVQHSEVIPKGSPDVEEVLKAVQTVA
jgi:peroxiredoxin